MNRDKRTCARTRRLPRRTLLATATVVTVAAAAAEIVGLCDVDENAADAVATRQQRMPRIDRDIRRLLDDRSIDAVVMATPNHWHAPATILACTAGKHVYLEKPCAVSSVTTASTASTWPAGPTAALAHSEAEKMLADEPALIDSIEKHTPLRGR